MKTAAQMIKDIRNRLLASSFTPHPITFADLHDEIWRETGVYGIDEQLSYESYYHVPGNRGRISYVYSTMFAIYPNLDFNVNNLARVYNVHLCGDDGSQTGAIVLVDDEFNQFLEWLRTDETIQVQAIA